MTATLSVVLPNHNHGHLIPRALAALLAQEHAPDEIIVVDDGSTDDSVMVIRRYAAENPTVRLLANNRNLGVIFSLNRGLQAARGRYVYFAAADDWVMSGFFAAAIAALNAAPDAGLFCGEARLIDGASGSHMAIRPPVRPCRRAGLVEPGAARALLARMDNWILTGSAVFRRDAVVWAGGFDERLGSFADGFVARKIALTFGFYFMPEVVAAWVIFADGVSRRNAIDPDRARHMQTVSVERIAADPVFPAWYPQRFDNRWRFGTSRLALAQLPVNRAALLAMGGRTSLDRRVLEVLLKLPSRRLVKLAALTWLWVRLRPTTLTGLARTAIARRLKQPSRTCQMAVMPTGPSAIRTMAGATGHE